MLTQKVLKRRFNYNPKTGKLLRKYRPLSDCYNLACQIKWNNKAGKAIGGHNGQGYLYTIIDTKSYLLHRLIWLVTTGEWPKYEIDHINGIRDDNRWCNLRDTANNAKNSTLQSNNTSGVPGVYYHKRYKRWIARIHVNKQSKYLGCYKTLKEATAVRKAAEVKYDYHPNHGRALNRV